MTHRQIQDDIIKRYRITLDPNSKRLKQAHAYPKERRVCNWIREDTIRSTFTLLHEAGHVETHKTNMRRSESEWYATTWAIDRAKEYGLKIPYPILYAYQHYILLEIYKGLRRHGSGYGEMNLYRYAGINKSAKEMTQLFPWAVHILKDWK